MAEPKTTNTETTVGTSPTAGYYAKSQTITPEAQKKASASTSFTSTSNKLSDTTKKRVDEIITSMPEDKARESLATGNFSDALDYSSSQEEQDNVVEAFILVSCDNGWKKYGVTWDKILPAKDLVFKVMRETGLTEPEDPFIGFITNYCQKNPSAKLNNTMMTMLNNDYADDTLTFEDIAGMGHDNVNHVIFNTDLYGKSQDDVDYIVNAYQWLSYKSNIDRMNENSLYNLNKNGTIYKNISSVFSEKPVNPVKVRDAIIYENGQAGGKINTRKDIETAMMLAGRPEEGTSRNYTKLDNAKNIIKDMTADEKKDLISAIVGADKTLSSDPVYSGVIKK
jgi:hypothetical protein